MTEDIRNEITRFVLEAPAGRFPDTGLPYFDEPLVGFAAADDPLFADYKTVIGPFHQTPEEVLASVAGPGVRAATVISWVLPINLTTRESNRGQRLHPSREWAWTRSGGERCNTALRRHLVDFLEARGHRTVAPQLAPGWRTIENPAVGIASTWSERHAAHAAGLGTFSLNGALITLRGMAHRCGSVVTDLELPPTPRPYASRGEWCLYLADGSCGVCVERCPVGALRHDGRDKFLCRGHVYGSVPAAVGELYGVTDTGCGLCQTRVPCEGRVPAGLRPGST
ncbi:MAG TPA: epoxyqueuosine reductase [Geobacteraceae bacterium]